MTGTANPRVGAWAIGVLALTASPALAAGDGGQPSIFAGDLGNIIWTLLTFLAVLFVLGKFAWGPILSALQKREEFIRDSLAGAKKDRQDAEAKLAELEQRLQDARGEAAGIVDEGRKAAEAVKRQIEQDTRKETDAMIDRARQEIGLARDTAVKDLYDLTATLATDAASRIIHKEIDAAQHERLIAESIEELTKKGDGSSN